MMPAGIYKREKIHHYTTWQLRFLKKNRKLPRRQLWEIFNRRYHTGISLSALCAKCKYIGLRTGRTGRFKKGHDSTWTEAQRQNWKPNAGNFKKGQMPFNHVAVGSEALTTDDEYVKVKIAEPNKWKYKHVLAWERYRGEIPRGMCLLFRDGNRQNCKVGNLQLITRLLLLLLNQHGYATASKKLKRSIMLLARLETKICTRSEISYHLRECLYVPHECIKCGKTIKIGQYYYDGGNGLRMHAKHKI